MAVEKEILLRDFVAEVVRNNDASRSRLTAILHEIQSRYNYLPEQALRDVAEMMGIPIREVYGVATFFTSFSMKPKGKHIVTVCMGTACHVRNSPRILDEICRILNIQPGETTNDMNFTVETVNCLGACAMGPIVVIDGKYYGEMTPSRIEKILKSYAKDLSTAVSRLETINSRDELESLRKKALDQRYAENRKSISVCCGPGCIARGSLDVANAIEKLVSIGGQGSDLIVRRTGCMGYCEKGPLVVVRPGDIFYQDVKPENAFALYDSTVLKDQVVEDLLYTDEGTGRKIKSESEIPFYVKQNKLITGSLGLIDPCSFEDYIAIGGYRALAKALFEMSPEEVIVEVEKAGLRGRGGGGFPAARKWRACREAKSPDGTKYVLCNADEGDPGAFMDRSLLEGNPHSVLEGMIIGAYAIGATQGYVYVRHEYPIALDRISLAVEQARARGLLGQNILGTDFSFDVGISQGAGAFVCGESTALMASIEGRVGEPREKYIHTAVKGLYLRPTNLNNVETWANVPLIINEGAHEYAKLGTENSKGTKIFSLVGKIRNTGLIEVPMGITLREIIYDIGGGIPGGKRFKAVQTGGPSGGCIPESLLDIPVDFDRLEEVGSMMGSGGMIAMDEDTCMVDVARYFLDFLCDESCGKCTPCREGLRQISNIVNRITKGDGKSSDLGLLEELSEVVRDTSLCGLGQTAPNPLLSTIRYFKEEYIEHIEDKKCRAGVCRALIRYRIDEERCNGCEKCLKNCPSGAVKGEKKQAHRIDETKCTRCGICYEVCASDAVIKE